MKSIITKALKHVLKTAFLSVFFISVNSEAQDQTIYYKADWRETKIKDSAAFYRPPAKKVGELYLLEDYYISGQLQMHGLSKDKVKALWEGEVTWYNEDGSILQQGNYKNNRLEGKWISFLDKKRLVANYKNGYFDSGERSFKNANSTTYTRIENDTIIDVIYGDKIDGIRYENYSLKRGSRFLSKYYDKNGKLIGERQAADNGYFKGIEVFYYYAPMRVREIRYYPFERFLGATIYYPNGQLRTLLEQKPEYKKTYYKSNGELLGSITYRLNKDFLKPVSGKEYYFPFSYREEKVEIINSVRTYQDEILLKQEAFYTNGNKKTITSYKDNNKDIQTSYDIDGNIIASVTYDGYYPLNGTELSNNKKATYKDGELVEEINYYPSTDIIFSKKTQTEEVFYDKDGKVIGNLELDYKNKYTRPINGTQFFASTDTIIASFEKYKDSKRVERTAFRKRVINDSVTKTFKSEDFFDNDGYDKIKEIQYYSNGSKQSEIEYKGYKKISGTFYDNAGAVLGTYNYEKKDGTLFEFFDDSDDLKLVQEEQEGKILKMKRYDYGPNNRYGNIDAVLEEELDLNCCVKTYTREGDIFAEAQFKDAKLWAGTVYDDKERTFYTIKDGKRNGVYRKYGYNKITILEEGQYKDDKKEGSFSYFKSTGILTKKEYFENDKLEGKASYYDEYGKEIASAIYKQNMPFEGTILTSEGYYRKPTEEIYKNGELQQRISYDEKRGKRVSKFVDGIETETTAYYVNTDKKRLTFSVKDKYIDGLVIRYDENGKELNRAIFEKNKLKSGTVFLTSRDFDKSIEYIILSKLDDKVTVVLKNKEDKVLFSAEEIIAEGYTIKFIDKMNLYLNYLSPDRLY